MDYCGYVNVFQGCGEIDLPKPEGPAAKWFFIKAGCGNTSPAALVPFGGMSVSPYSGGYPTGYGNHLPNSHSRPAKFEGGDKLIGFAHLQQSGTGAIGYYYNYALTVPYYPSSPFRRKPENEYAEPGYYSCTLEDIKCELTATKNTAVHRYTFGSENPVLKIDFSNNGLNCNGEHRGEAEVISIETDGKKTVTAVVKAEGITMCFAAECKGRISLDGSQAVFTPDSNTAELKLSISFRSTENALENINNTADFEETRKSAYNNWNEYLSRFRIETEEGKIKEIFYSNLYHSLIKPSDWSGESFVYTDETFMTDFATLWDMYKTGFPLICMSYREIAEKSCETLLLLCDALGNIPNCFGLSDKYLLHSGQARTLGSYVLMTAYRYGIRIDPHRMVKAIEKDIFAEDKTDFTVDGRCRSATWMLDMSDCCALCAEIAEEIGEKEIAEKLRPLSLQWEKCYSPETGLMTDDSDYYEGTKYNYSFRQMVDMDRRIETAGGKKSFVRLLDEFFGYGEPDTVQPTDPFDYKPVEEGIKLGRFEGFNNESDTEAPFSYIYAGRHDRTCEIIRSGMKYMFTTGRGGLPGNNDSGALSSYYVFMTLGLFPVAGQNLFLIGSPFVDSAEIDLSSGRTLSISVAGNSEENIYVKSVKFNNKDITDFRIPADELMNGGRLEFVMSEEKCNV